jgi:hypothetical protein
MQPANILFYFSPRRLRFLPLPTLNPAFFLHSLSQTSLQLAFQTGPGMINGTVTHLLVSFNHLKISVKLTVKAHPGASQRRSSLSAILAPHPSSSQTFWTPSLLAKQHLRSRDGSTSSVNPFLLAMGSTGSVGCPIGLASKGKLDLDFTNAAETHTGRVKTIGSALTSRECE